MNTVNGEYGKDAYKSNCASRKQKVPGQRRGGRGTWAIFGWISVHLSEPLRTPFYYILWPTMDPILVPNSGKCNFRHSRLVTFWHFYNRESSYFKIRSISVVSRVRSLILPGLFRGNECELILTKLKSLLTRILLSQSKIPQMYDPIVVTLLKMQPRYGQFSGTSL